MNFDSTLLPQTNEPAEIQKSLLDLLGKISQASNDAQSSVENVGYGIVKSERETNGSYIHFGDGTMIAWGTAAGVGLSLDSSGAFSNYTGTTTIYFPYPFTQIDSVLVTSRMAAIGNYGQFISWAANSLSSINIRWTSAGNTTPAGACWAAFGRWK